LEDLRAEIESEDSKIEGTHHTELQAEAKYDSGCESEKSEHLEKSEQTVSRQSVDDGSSETSGSHKTDHVEMEEPKTDSMKKCMYYYAVFVLKHFFRFKSFTL
jgi:hypothetical protein